MAVIQISKIQVRRGLQENLPQLAGGELGWSVDERRLWIGNGTLVEGAAEIGNTEILTANGDVLQAIQTYNFKGEESGYISITGADISNPTYRTLQNKVDEQISVRDFGAVGDGITDDSVAIQRAFDQVYPKAYSGINKVRRIIHFPAGTYKISVPLYIPPYAKIVGDGMDSTIIYQNAVQEAINFKDSLWQSGGSFGLNGAELPVNIAISDMTIYTDEDTTVMTLDSAKFSTFFRVHFKSAKTNPYNSGTSAAAVKLLSSKGIVRRTHFRECRFTNHTYGILGQGNIEGTIIDSCVFDTLYQGIRAENLGGSPRFRILHCRFENIGAQAIYSGDNSITGSEFNYYANVGNGGGTSFLGLKANTNVLSWNTVNNYSILDVFLRTKDEELDKPTVGFITGISQPGTLVNKTTVGSFTQQQGVTTTVLNNTSANVASFTASEQNILVDYVVRRGTGQRAGTLKIAHYQGTNVNVDEEYSETSSIGVNMDVLGDGLRANLQVTTDNSGDSANVSYAIRTFV